MHKFLLYLFRRWHAYRHAVADEKRQRCRVCDWF